jgi:hypothetical protein
MENTRSPNNAHSFRTCGVVPSFLFTLGKLVYKVLTGFQNRLNRTLGTGVCENFFKWDLKHLNRVGKSSKVGWGRFPESGGADFRTKVGKSGDLNIKGARTRIFTLLSCGHTYREFYMQIKITEHPTVAQNSFFLMLNYCGIIESLGLFEEDIVRIL